MPRLSLYRPNRTNDYQFLDKTIEERYTVGGLDIFCHKYMGPIVDTSVDPGNGNATLPQYSNTNPLFIEDLLLLENRDRVYDPNVYIMRGVYTHNDINFDLTQFGLFVTGILSILIAIAIPSAIQLIFTTASIAVPGLIFPLILTMNNKYEI